MFGVNVLNILKLNIHQILKFMFKIKANTVPSIFKPNSGRFNISFRLDLVRTVSLKID